MYNTITNKHFNPRSREGSDTLMIIVQLTALNFNPRSREGSDDTMATPYKLPSDFNPRSREGSDSLSPALRHFYLYFNPRSREGSDGSRTPGECRLHRFQSALPRGERRDIDESDGCTGNISIRAPARGATISGRRI